MFWWLVYYFALKILTLSRDRPEQILGISSYWEDVLEVREVNNKYKTKHMKACFAFVTLLPIGLSVGGFKKSKWMSGRLKRHLQGIKTNQKWDSASRRTGSQPSSSRSIIPARDFFGHIRDTTRATDFRACVMYLQSSSPRVEITRNLRKRYGGNISSSL